MALMWWWLGLGLGVVVAALVVVRWVTALRGRRARAGVAIAHTDVFKALPRYRTLARGHLRALTLQLLATLIATVGALLLASRFVAIDANSPEMHSRDVILCMDVSGSMKSIDAAIIDSYLGLVDRLQGERIGLVVFDAAAATVFPLTDDYTYVRDELTLTRDALVNNEPTPVLAVTGIGHRGSSLIGDGLESCLLHFDEAAQERPRTVVLATDNELSGNPLFSLQQATDDAVARHVLVYAIGPTDMNPQYRDEAVAQVTRTGGELLTIGGQDTNRRIVAGVEAKQRAKILSLPQARNFDVLWPGATLAGLGLVGLVLAARRARR